MNIINSFVFNPLDQIVAKNRINGNNGIDVQVPIEDDNLTMQTLAENQVGRQARSIVPR